MTQANPAEPSFSVRLCPTTSADQLLLLEKRKIATAATAIKMTNATGVSREYCRMKWAAKRYSARTPLGATTVSHLSRPKLVLIVFRVLEIATTPPP